MKPSVYSRHGNPHNAFRGRNWQSSTPTFDALAALAPVYLDASRLDKQFTDQAATTQVTNDLDVVNAIQNMGTSGGTLTTVSTANRYEYNANHANGQGAWRNDGTTRGLTGNLGSTLDLSATYWTTIVCTVPHTATAFRPLFQIDNNNASFVMSRADHGSTKWYGYGCRVNFDRPNILHVVSFCQSTTTGEKVALVNGVEQAGTTDTTTAHAANMSRIHLGRRFDSTTTNFYDNTEDWTHLVHLIKNADVTGSTFSEKKATMVQVHTELMTRFGIP